MSMAVAYGLKKRQRGESPCEACRGGTCTKHYAEGGETKPPDGGVPGVEILVPMGDKPSGGSDYMGKMMGGNGMAHGGLVEDDEELIKRIMNKRNATPPITDEEPAEYDDLVLRDDLHADYTGANSGDEHGNKTHDEEDKDIVSRVMRSRAKKDRNPRPA